MDISKKVRAVMRVIYITIKVCTRDVYIIPLAHAKELLVIGAMLSVISLIRVRFIGTPLLTPLGCLFGSLILGIIYYITKKGGK